MALLGCIRSAIDLCAAVVISAYILLMGVLASRESASIRGAAVLDRRRDGNL